MPPDISLAQFNKIASDDYSAGQIDIKIGEDGKAKFVKINNHVWKKAHFKSDPSTQRILWKDGDEIDPETRKPIKVPVPRERDKLDAQGKVVMDAIIEDAKKMGGDKSYQVDIGV